MKKLILSILMVVVALSLVAVPVLAYPMNDIDVSVEFDDVDIDGGLQYNGTYIPGLWEGGVAVVSGGITITSEAQVLGLFVSAYAEGNAEYSITDSDSIEVASGSYSDDDFDWGLFWASADASFYYTWQATLGLEDGEYTIDELGEAYAEYSKWFWDDSEGTSNSRLTTFDVTRFDKYSYYEDMFIAEFMDFPNIDGSRMELSDGKMVTSNTITLIVHKGLDIYKFVVPAGTYLINPTGGAVTHLRIAMMVDGVPLFDPFDAVSNNPISLYKLEGDPMVYGDAEWVEVVTFTEIVDRLAIPN